VSDKEVGVCAFESNDFQRRSRLDLLDQVIKLVIHAIVDGVDGRVIERDAPIFWRRFVGNDSRADGAHGASIFDPVIQEC
jgi:hypothetical protein